MSLYHLPRCALMYKGATYLLVESTYRISIYRSTIFSTRPKGGVGKAAVALTWLRNQFIAAPPGRIFERNFFASSLRHECLSKDGDASQRARISRAHYQAVSTRRAQPSIATLPYRSTSGTMSAAVSRSPGAQISVQTSDSMHEMFEIAKSLV